MYKQANIKLFMKSGLISANLMLQKCWN